MKMFLKKINYKYFGIGVVVILLMCGVCLYIKNNSKNGGFGDNVLYNIYPDGSEVVELEMGTYFNEKQTDFCKIKLPGNYFGWAMYLSDNGENLNFEMANSHELGYSIENGLLKQEEAVQQFHYSNSHLGKEEVTDIYANIFTNDQITYDGMKKQTANAVEISDIAFYSKGDKKYTDIDVTLYYRVNDDITLQISYKGPLAEQISVKTVANQLYELVEVIKK